MRTTFSSEPIITRAVATMENDPQVAAYEEALFQNLANTRRTSSLNTTPPNALSSAPNQVASLNNVQGVSQGPARSLKVHKGDKIRLQVNARYEEPPAASPSSAIAGMVTTAVSGGTAGAASEFGSGMTQQGGEALGGGMVSMSTGSPAVVPSASMNCLIFNERFEPVGNPVIVSITETAKITATNPNAVETLFVEIDITENGYINAYLSHDGTEDIWVHFDDFVVEQETYIVQTQDYYPFGATHEQDGYTGSENKYRYQGKEWQAELGLNLYDFHARQYDPLLGRFTTIDPLAVAVAGMSPYAGIGNNPVIYVDPDGRLFFVPILVGAVIGGAINLGIQAVQGNIQSVGDGFAAFGIGAVAGAAAVVAPQVIGSLAGVGLTTATGGVAAGFIPGAVAGSIGGALNSFGNALYFQDASLGEAAVAGLQGGAIGALTGGLIGGGLAKIKGQNFWGPKVGQAQTPQIAQIERPRALKVSTELPRS
ncbi:MAG: RHS repeat-associated core domain-containing protein, partial [Bacteroidota bacterium]